MRFLELKIPPLAAFLFFALLIRFGAAFLPLQSWLIRALPIAAWIGLALALVGAFFMVAAVVELHRHETTVNPFKPEYSSSLVTSGVYRYSRNPMYLGMALLLTAWVLWLGQPLVLPGALLFVLYVDRFQIRPEERALAEIFGNAWHTYYRKTRRWVGIPGR